MANQQKTLVSNNDVSLSFPTDDTFSLEVNLSLGWDENNRTLTNSLGNNVTIPLANSTRPGLLSIFDFDKLQTISENAEPNRTVSELNALNLDAKTVNGFSIESSVPSNASFSDTTYQIGDGGLTEINFTVQRRDKLIGIENGAEKNRSLVELNSLDLDAKTVNGFSIESSVPLNAIFSDTTYDNLSEFQNDVGYITNSEISNFESSIDLNNRDQANRNRSNHTGTQSISTVDGFSLTSLSMGEVLKYDGTNFTNLPLELSDISNVGSLAGLSEITNTKISSSAGINLSKLEINPLDRQNHTGTQDISTIVGLGASAEREVTGINPLVVTGSPGTSENLIEWDSNGDIFDSGISKSYVLSLLKNIAEDTSPELGGDLDSKQHKIKNYKSDIITKTTKTETLLLEESGCVIEFDNSTSITLSIPDNLPVGWRATLVRVNSGSVSINTIGNAILRNIDGHSSIRGRWGHAEIYVRSNDNGNEAEYVFYGDTI